MNHGGSRTMANRGGSKNRGGGPRGLWCGSPRNRTVRWLGGSRFAKTRTEPWRFGVVHANRHGLWNHSQHYARLDEEERRRQLGVVRTMASVSHVDERGKREDLDELTKGDDK